MSRTSLWAAALAPVVLVAAAPVWADAASPGFYLGAGVGKNDLSAEDDGFSFDGDDTAFKVFAGYQLNPYFGLEGAYIDGGTAEDTVDGVDVELDTRAFEASVVGSVPLGSLFSLYARAGVLFWDLEATIDGESGEDDGNDFSYAGGAALNLGNASIRLEYASADLADTELALVSLSGLWKFAM